MSADQVFENLKTDIVRTPRPEDETERLKSLRSLRILDTAHEERFDRITRIARKAFDVPVSTIGLIDEDRLWFKASCGLSLREVGRDGSFCGWNILDDLPLVITDARRDPRFADWSTVKGDPHLRFYAGHPLFSADSRRIGSFCVVSYSPREFSDDDMRMLKDFGAWVQAELLQPRGRNTQLEVALERERFEQHPRIDSVARFWKREEILRRLEEELALARGEGQSVGVMLIGIDRFTELSGQLGKLPTDLVLADVAQSVRLSVRPYDSLGRWTNDQFLLILPGADLAKTAVAGERIRQRRAASRVETSNGSVNVTITVAVASSSDDREVTSLTLLSAVEDALDHAWEGGGDRTRLASVTK